MTDGQNFKQTEEQTDRKRKTDRNETGEREKTDNRQMEKISKRWQERQRDRNDGRRQKKRCHR
jgi:hypothetical protein